MVDIVAYGEDGLTLWAMGNRLADILRVVGDSSPESSCQVYYRPSFGRKGGHKSAQFGEFDFILLSRERIYLGESKWDRSPEVKNGEIMLRKEQTIRHAVMKCYIESWFETEGRDWTEAKAKTVSLLRAREIEKPVAPRGSRLEANLLDFLRNLDDHFMSGPDIVDMLLFFYEETSGKPLKGDVPGFRTVSLPYQGYGQVRATV